MALHGKPRTEFAFLVAYAFLITLVRAYFSNRFVAVLTTRSIEAFSLVFLPLQALFAHALLLRLLPVRVYWGIAGLDFLLMLGIATYHDYFHDNVDIHTVLGCFSEGAQVGGYILQLVPKGFLVGGGIALVAECYLARKVKAQLRKWFLVPLGGVVLLGFMAATYKVPLSRAKKEWGYATCLKTHGYYATVFCDLLLSGAVPSEKDLVADLDRANKRDPAVMINACIPSPHPYRNLLAIQVESLDYNVLDYHYRGLEVTPFLNRLKGQAVFLKLKAFHFGASGSAGSDFQFLTGRLPLRSYPIYRIQSLDYGEALPAVYRKRGIPSVAFHGNSSAYFGRGQAYKKMKFERFHDAEFFPRPDTRWGVSDRVFLTCTRKAVEQHLDRPHFYFLITLSSHGPFDYVEHHAIPATGIVGKYLNSIHYADQALKEFLTRLRGTHLVILYGDHASGVKNEHYISREPGGEEYVPGFIFVLRDGTPSKPRLAGDRSNFLDGSLDLRSLYYFARNAYP